MIQVIAGCRPSTRVLTEALMSGEDFGILDLFIAPAVYIASALKEYPCAR